ncbi:MAG: metal ABC transporter permease [Acidimicrobiaceae bacterium]|nr:metal ABC transporter permease [Acidimicrobiaceae bacterium]
MAVVATLIFGPGFFVSPAVRVALVIGVVVAVTSAPAGVFTILRRQSFAGHSLADVGSTGGSAAYLFGIGALWGFVGIGALAAAAMEIVGVRQARSRDLATGIVLGASLGLSALFLYWDTTAASTTGATINVLFGSIYTIPSSTVVPVAIFAGLAIGILALLYRPLLLSSLGADLAAARGVPVRLVGIGFFVALVLAVSLSALTIGAILSTALLIGPAATALRITRRPGTAIAAAAAVGTVATWLGVLLSWDSYYWGSGHRGWPVSFFVVTLVFVFYLLAGIFRPRRPARQAGS